MRYLGWRPITEVCSWDVAEPDPFPWEHNNKKFVRNCRARVNWEHDGRPLCTHHAKTLALRMVTENLQEHRRQ